MNWLCGFFFNIEKGSSGKSPAGSRARRSESAGLIERLMRSRVCGNLREWDGERKGGMCSLILKDIA